MTTLVQNKRLESIFSYDSVFTPTDVVKGIKQILAKTHESGAIAISEKNTISAVLVDASEYQRLIALEKEIEYLQDLQAVEKGRNGGRHTQAEVDAIRRKADQNAGF